MWWTRVWIWNCLRMRLDHHRMLLFLNVDNSPRYLIECLHSEALFNAGLMRVNDGIYRIKCLTWGGRVLSSGKYGMRTQGGCFDHDKSDEGPSSEGRLLSTFARQTESSGLDLNIHHPIIGCAWIFIFSLFIK